MSTNPGYVGAKREILKNTFFNLAGSAAPLVVAIITIPLLIQGFGKEKFGILSLAWVLIGYFSLADFGLSRALTKFVSERIGQGKKDELPSLIWTALFLMAILGIAGAILLALASPLLVTSILKLKSTNDKEILQSFYVLSAGVPFTIMAAALRGILEALMRFDLANYVRIALGIATYTGPAIVLIFSENIVFAVLILVVSRIIFFFAYLRICFLVLPEMRAGMSVHRSHFRPLLGFGGWITVSNVISPIMVNFDRFFLGAMVSVSSLAYYSTPWEVVTRLLIIPSALAGVMFPIFSQHNGAERALDPDLYYKSMKYVFLIMFPFCMICTVFAKEALHIWLGPEFALASFRVMQVMAVAVLMNGLALIPFTLIQGIGRPDMTAKFHIIELVLYIPILVLLIKKIGILGAAVAWLIRVTIDLVILHVYTDRSVMPAYARKRPTGKPLMRYPLLILIIFILSAAFMRSLAAKIVTVILLLAAHASMFWTKLLDSDEKRYMLNKARGK